MEETAFKAKSKRANEETKLWARQVAFLIVVLGRDAYPANINQARRQSLKRMISGALVANLVDAAHASGDSHGINNEMRPVAGHISTAASQIVLFSLLQCTHATAKRSMLGWRSSWSSRHCRKRTNALVVIERLVLKARSQLLHRARSLPIIRVNALKGKVYMCPGQVDRIHGLAFGAKLLLQAG